MARLPSLRGIAVVQAFEKLGWLKIRQSSSHVILVREGQAATLSVPLHDPVAKGTLRSLIRSAGLTVDEFVKAARSPKRKR
jgi:predicted RNA binding protein YcfA (HicA-like mRNA interferase family)